jgi:ABC-type polysaccharide/polyol phosphate export permease
MDMTQERLPSYRTSSARPSPIGSVFEAIREIRGRRRLIRYLAQADLKKKGTDTLFGNIWWVLDPLLQMAVYVILVTVIFARSQPAYPLFIFAAILPWKWFTTVTTDAIQSVSGQDKLIKQLQFPKIVLPAAAMLGGVLEFTFGLIPLGGMLVLMYPSYISIYLLWIPVVAVVQFFFSFAFGLVLSALNVFFRDIGNVARHVMRLWFYVSPALYGADTVATVGKAHPTIYKLMQLNPFYTILNSYRDAIYYHTMPDLRGLAVVLAASFVLLFFTTMVFKRLEPAFAKIL